MPQSDSLRQLKVLTQVIIRIGLFRQATRVTPAQRRLDRSIVPIAALLLSLTVIVPSASLARPACTVDLHDDGSGSRQGIVRVATFNAALNRPSEGQLITDLKSGDDRQIRAIAELVRAVRPDILLINEFDFDAESEALMLFKRRYLESKDSDNEPMMYPYTFTAPANTGLDSGFDLDNDARTGGPGDAWGYGEFPGQYAMLLLSRFPIKLNEVRTFQQFLWKDMPGALLPPDWYEPEELASLRLSSKSHWDIPIAIDTGDRIHTTHVLTSHPVPPVFDGPEDRNGRRNYDEIRLFADYISDTRGNAYIYDDHGQYGGLDRDYESFLIMGDLNADPIDGDSLRNASRQLIDHEHINDDVTPSSALAFEVDRSQGGQNRHHRGDPRLDTADFNDQRTGNLRVDYILPSKRGIRVICATVLWQNGRNDESDRLNAAIIDASDHRLVFMDVRFGD